MAARDNIGGLLRILAGPGIWFVAFSILYAIATAGCVGLIASAKPFASWVVVLAGIAALAWLAVFGAGRGGGDAFLALMTRLLAIVSLVAALWLLLPLVALQNCEHGQAISTDIETDEYSLRQIVRQSPSAVR
jgi:hypothetical protein